MECNQEQVKVAAIKTLYENFWEEKSECDLLIPDYYPAAEKIIQCSAVPVIVSKEIEGERLNVDGVCRFCIIYQGEDGGEVKSLSETVHFNESFLMKETGISPWAQTVLRVSGTSCRLLNPRKISAKTTVSVAVKVRDQVWMNTIGEVDCSQAEALYTPATVYTVIDHVSDTVRIQGEIEVHTDIQDILKTEGSVCIKDIKILPGKAIVKGVANLFLLFTSESNPLKVEQTSTAIPFSQVLEIQQQDENCMMEAAANIINLRSDVEADENGKNRMISLTATVLTEGEVYRNQQHRFLSDIYSFRYPLECKDSQIITEELVEKCEVTDHLRHEFHWDENDAEIIQVTGLPLIQKITGQNKTLCMEGVLDVSIFVMAGNQCRSIDKSFPFTLKKEIKQLSEHMRCEVRPCIMTIGGSIEGNKMEIHTEIQCASMIFAKNHFDVISEVRVDTDHPLEYSDSLPLVVYFAEKGERLWDIARKYATSVSAIMSANEMEQEILSEKRLLLIART